MIAAFLETGSSERLYSGLSVLVSAAAEGREARALAAFGALALLLDPELEAYARQPAATPSLAGEGRERFARSLAELRATALELPHLRLWACAAAVETMGLTAAAVEAAGLHGVRSTPRFLRDVAGAELLFV